MDWWAVALSMLVGIILGCIWAYGLWPYRKRRVDPKSQDKET